MSSEEEERDSTPVVRRSRGRRRRRSRRRQRTPPTPATNSDASSENAPTSSSEPSSQPTTNTTTAGRRRRHRRRENGAVFAGATTNGGAPSAPDRTRPAPSSIARSIDLRRRLTEAWSAIRSTSETTDVWRSITSNTSNGGSTPTPMDWAPSPTTPSRPMAGDSGMRTRSGRSYFGVVTPRRSIHDRGQPQPSRTPVSQPTVVRTEEVEESEESEEMEEVEEAEEVETDSETNSEDLDLAEVSTDIDETESDEDFVVPERVPRLRGGRRRR